MLEELAERIGGSAGFGGIDRARHRGRTAAGAQGRRIDSRRVRCRTWTNCARATRDGKDWIANLQQDEIERTGIASLKVRFNSVFGYYIEVTKSNLDKVPAHYIRKQTIASGERFITPELKEMEGKILGAEERSVKLEYELFQRVREQVLEQLPRLQQTAAALAQLDVLAAFARDGAAVQLLPAGNRRGGRAAKFATGAIRFWNKR